MSENLMMALQEKMTGFSKGQKLLAKYILAYYDKAALMTASKLGKTVGVSEATVIRFAGELGFDGYPGLQKAMQTLLYNKVSPDDRMDITDDGSDMVSNVFRAEMENLRQTAVFVEKDILSAVVDAVANARNIYILGCKTNRFPAEYFGYYLQLLFSGVNIITESGSAEMLEKLIRVDNEDIVFALNFPQMSSATEKAARYCRKIGATVVGLSDRNAPGFEKCCDHILFAKCEQNDLAAYMSAPFTLIHALLSQLASGREKLIFDKLNAINDANNDRLR